MSGKKYNDYELLYLIDFNDEDAFRVLKNKYQPICYALCKQYYKDSSKSVVSYEDLLSGSEEAFMQAFRTFDSNRDVTFYTYFVMCLSNKLNSFRRKVYQKNNAFYLNHQPYDYDIEDYYADRCNEFMVEDSASIFDFLSLEDSVKEYLYHNDPFSSRIFMLRMSGLKYKEIANILEITDKTVTQQIQTVRRDLKKILD